MRPHEALPECVADAQQRWFAPVDRRQMKGTALRPLDVDVPLLHGYGFPRHRGGPMAYADSVGLPKILDDVHTFAREDPLFWRPSPLLEKLVVEGRGFASLNPPRN